MMWGLPRKRSPSGCHLTGKQGVRRCKQRLPERITKESEVAEKSGARRLLSNRSLPRKESIMTTLVRSLGENKKGQWIVVGVGICLVWAAIAIPGLYRSRTALTPTAASVPEMTENYSFAH